MAITGRNGLVKLTGIEPESLEQLREWRNKEELRVHFREFREITKSMQEEWYEKCVKNNDTSQFNFEIRTLKNAELIGHCGLYYVKWTNRTAEFGIYVGDQKFRGRGYGSDALCALLCYGFNELGLNRIWCEVYDTNSAISIYKRLGFKHEGTMRQHHFTNGKFVDSHILGLLSNEWQQIQKIDKKKLSSSADTELASSLLLSFDFMKKT